MNSDPDAAQIHTLLTAVAGGDHAAFTELYAQTSPHLLAVLLRMLKKVELAEEALQDCYMRVWQRSESYAPERGSPLAWLTTIARYRALDLLRARRPEISESSLDNSAAFEREDAGARPDDLAQETEGLRRLAGCMEGLSDEQRKSVLLAYYEGYTHTELAQRLNAPMGTVKSWVRRGLQALRTCLEGR